MWIADSYAKINLGSTILGQTPDGKLNVKTGLCFIDWSDRVEVQQAPTIQIEIDDPNDQEVSKKIINQAIDVLQKEVGLQHNYHFNIKKRIPVEAGLGSKASNAASTLKMLNKIEDLGLSRDELLEMGQVIDTDLTPFLHESPGIYHDATHFESTAAIQPNFDIVICYPKVDMSQTSYIYNQDVAQSAPDIELNTILTREEPFEWQYMLFNDFEQTAFQENPLPGNLKDQFYEFGAAYAAMSARGPAVYGIFEQNFVATNAYKTLIDLGYTANLTKPNFSPDFGIYRKG